MTDFWEGFNGESKFYSIKEGESIKLNVAQMEKSPAAKFKPKKKDGTEQDFAVVIKDENGKELTVGSFALQFALQNARVSVGDTIKIDHPKRGVYMVEVL
jgi:hypothetical protein